MGGVCSICTDPNGEPAKRGMLTTVNQNDILVEGGPMMRGNNAFIQDEHRTLSMIRKEQEGLEEAARLELLVSNAARAMVSVRSTRGATYYHDQGFAAALCAHLQQTMPHHTLRPTLPHIVTTTVGVATKTARAESTAATTATHVLTILSRPIPAQPDDRRWETLLNQASGSKEQIFAKCPQIVESLL